MNVIYFFCKMYSHLGGKCQKYSFQLFFFLCLFLQMQLNAVQSCNTSMSTSIKRHTYLEGSSVIAPFYLTMAKHMLMFQPDGLY